MKLAKADRQHKLGDVAGDDISCWSTGDGAVDGIGN